MIESLWKQITDPEDSRDHTSGEWRAWRPVVPGGRGGGQTCDTQGAKESLSCGWHPAGGQRPELTEGRTHLCGRKGGAIIYEYKSSENGGFAGKDARTTKN